MILLDDGALADLERIFLFHAGIDSQWALRQLQSVRSAIGILDEHPHIGRLVAKGELRELVISVGKRGFIALYQYEELEGLIRVLAVLHQREAGYRGR